MHDRRTPVFLLTGFLGSGKTTLLNEWLKSPGLGNAAVIVNEFGSVGIDSDLIAASNEGTIELTTGCLCCTVSGDLVETLRDLHVKRTKGEIRPFEQVLVETTGLADPAPVIQALMTMPVAMEYRLARVITAIEAPQGVSTLDRNPESVKQVAVADDIVLTKTDLVRGGEEVLLGRIAALNPGAAIHQSAPGDIPDIVDVANAGSYDMTLRPADVRDWLRAPEPTGDGGHVLSMNRKPGHSRHDHAIGTFCLVFDEDLEWQHVAAWLDALVIAHGEDMLRVKGILRISGQEKPIVVQSVQRLFHPPFQLDAWPEGERNGRIVFITRGISEAFVREVLDTIRGIRPLTESAKKAI